MAIEGSVSISGVSYPIYGAAADANVYFKAHTNAAAWASATTGDKNVALVSSARSFDRQRWLGTPTDLVTPQNLAWPRKSITDRNGQAVPDSVIPDDVAEASWEWALELIRTPGIAEVTPGSNTKNTSETTKVDVITITTASTFFQKTIGKVGRFPTHIQELLQPFLAGRSTTRTVVSGLGEESPFADDGGDFGVNSFGVN